MLNQFWSWNSKLYEYLSRLASTELQVLVLEPKTGIFGSRADILDTWSGDIWNVAFEMKHFTVETFELFILMEIFEIIKFEFKRIFC